MVLAQSGSLAFAQLLLNNTTVLVRVPARSNGVVSLPPLCVRDAGLLCGHCSGLCGYCSISSIKSKAVKSASYGIATFEIYETEGNTDERARLLNLSTRCIVNTGNEVAIGGMIIGDTSASNSPDRRVLMFGKGPSLAAAGLSGTLAQPVLTDVASSTVNTSWQNLMVGEVEELVEATRAPTFQPKVPFGQRFVPAPIRPYLAQQMAYRELD